MCDAREPRRVLKSAGFGLPVLLFFLIMIMMLTMVSAVQISQWQNTVTHGLATTRASYAAEAGLARVLLELTKDPEYNPGVLTLPDNDPDGLPFTRPELGAKIELINNFSGETSLTTPDGEVPPGHVWVRAEGTINGVPYRSQRTGAKAVYTRPDVTVNLAIRQLSNDRIYVGEGALIRSYVSAGPNDPKPPGTYGNAARIRTSKGGISILPSATFNGVVEIPTVTTPVDGNVPGGIVVEEESPPILKFDDPLEFQGVVNQDQNHPGSGFQLPSGQPYGYVHIDAGRTLVLGPGIYYIQELVLEEAAEIVVENADLDNPCILYLGDLFRAKARAKINWEGAPRLLQIYGTNTSKDGWVTVDLMEDTQTSSVIAGKEIALTLFERAQLYGGVDGKLIELKDHAQLVYDETLNEKVLEGIPSWVTTSKLR